MPSSQASTQDFVSIRDIKDNVIIQKNGQMRMVLLASSINFALKSVDEQKGILLQFQSFLNTLDFDLQIYIQSRRLNIEPYLELLQTLDGKQNNDLMRIQIREYIEFIRTFTKDIDVMSKNFFVVIPYSPQKVDFSRSITNLLSPKKRSQATPNEAQFDTVSSSSSAWASSLLGLRESACGASHYKKMIWSNCITTYTIQLI